MCLFGWHFGFFVCFFPPSVYGNITNIEFQHFHAYWSELHFPILAMLYNRNRKEKQKISLTCLYKMKSNTKSIFQPSVKSEQRQCCNIHTINLQQLLYSVMKEHFVFIENHVLSRTYSLSNASAHTSGF